MTKLTPHFTLEEMTFSQIASRRGIDNTPPDYIKANLLHTCKLLEQVRGLLGNVPIIVSSGYRCPALNKAVGGAKSSAHLYGLAADFTAPRFGTPYEIAMVLSRTSLQYDQLIHEYGDWVHIGFDHVLPRRQNLSIFRRGSYLNGIQSKP